MTTVPELWVGHMDIHETNVSTLDSLHQTRALLTAVNELFAVLAINVHAFPNSSTVIRSQLPLWAACRRSYFTIEHCLQLFKPEMLQGTLKPFMPQ